MTTITIPATKLESTIFFINITSYKFEKNNNIFNSSATWVVPASSHQPSFLLPLLFFPSIS
ncbi:hypothetical protein COV53_06090 [Candidatus Gottesmanbacteria bacterium CG11_big_fil_rev_8_21_14_0_20_37_11]|uniref:Uncharacterized protein n=3 Tax=Candidatus Gottesmaniibacteriota TaxID=1752720 RepID=A0A2M7RPY0_9BACT|nr:MAG: hypothetical protein AUJ73_03405 [Candidatus Gottesmanbacteria bacterium CG1_02_37_22]PIP32998.1 MAG: hypothetical protein COX23_01915 [Candidatus Gottesmanbacteria bacterium CG23_combo_of_CG06-09_8_20_14_all_37_19]PIR07870.1 MAG: hypothetical protein COV53_06090 [Candidatus Gottesmanbacteria bacterium CG11_big_fil_rev_8_21_14_0_20_37_11]PIZ02391.1 MAG: hypothetical protein COY59_05250 [Candidatus Gottesmanbacteria bacterium CG_4_10_14_0_8_um_filter_37_24]